MKEEAQRVTEIDGTEEFLWDELNLDQEEWQEEVSRKEPCEVRNFEIKGESLGVTTDSRTRSMPGRIFHYKPFNGRAKDDADEWMEEFEAFLKGNNEGAIRLSIIGGIFRAQA